MKENIKKVKKKEKGPNIIQMVVLNFKENIKMIKNGMEQDLIKKIK